MAKRPLAKGSPKPGQRAAARTARKGNAKATRFRIPFSSATSPPSRESTRSPSTERANQQIATTNIAILFASFPFPAPSFAIYYQVS